MESASRGMVLKVVYEIYDCYEDHCLLRQATTVSPDNDTN